MNGLILAPELPRTPYMRKYRFRMKAAPTWAEIQAAMFREGDPFIQAMKLHEGADYLPGSLRLRINFEELQRLQGMVRMDLVRVVERGGPFPVIRPKAIHIVRHHRKATTGPHDRGTLDRSTDYLVETHPADEWDYEIAGLFVQPAILTEILDTDLEAATHGR